MTYHPPKVISNNGATIYSADLAYEGHGKCGQTRVIRSGEGGEEGDNIFDSTTEGSVNAWKMVILNVGGTGNLPRCDCNLSGAIRIFKADNMSEQDNVKLQGRYYGESMPVEIMADISYVELDNNYHSVAILYLDCSQS